MLAMAIPVNVAYAILTLIQGNARFFFDDGKNIAANMLASASGSKLSIETPAAEPAGAGPRVRGAARRSRVLSMQSTGTEDRPTGEHAEARRSKGKSRHLLENSRKGPLFYAHRIKTPYREVLPSLIVVVGGVDGTRAC